MNDKKHLWTIVTAVVLASALLVACGGGTPDTPTEVPPPPTPAATPTPSADEHVELGIEYHEQGQLDQAIAEYEIAIELEPDNADAYRNLGSAYSDQGRWEDAAAAYEEAISLVPDFGEAYGDLVWVYVSLDQLPEAIAAGEEAIELAPDYTAAHINLGIAYNRQGRLDEAIAEYEEAIRLDPDDALPHYNLGILYEEQDNPDAAIAEYEEAIRLDPDHVTAHDNLGIAYYKQGRFNEAIAEWETAIQIAPDHANAHKNLGIGYADQGRAEEAIVEFETYLSLRPDAPDKEMVEGWIAELEEPVAGQGVEYSNAEGGYSLFYPEGWHYDEDETLVTFAESEEALKDDPGKASMVMFIAWSLDEVADGLGLEEITDPAVALEGMAESLEAEAGEIETGQIAGYPAVLTDISGDSDGVPYEGGLAAVLLEDRCIYGVAIAPPDQWEAFRPIFVDMLNSLSFFEP